MVEDFRLTVTPQGSGSAQLQAAQAEVATAKRPWDLFKGVVTTVPKAAGVLHEKHIAENKSEDLRQGTARAAELLAETSTLSAKDRDIALTAEYDKIMLGESENNDVHNKAFLSAITPTYFSAKSKAQAEFNMGNASLAVDGLIIPEMLPEGYDKTEGLDWIAKENGVDVAVVRNMYLAKQTDYFAGQMLLQDTPEGVAEIKTKITDNRKSLQSSKFYGSKAADWTSAIKQSDAKLKSTEIAINKKFQKEALSRIAIATGDTSSSATSYNKPFVEVQEDFKRAYGDNPETYRNKVQDYKDKVILAEESRAWQVQFEPGDVHTVLPDNAQLKDEWQKSVSVGLSKAFLEDSYEKFIDISINDSAFVKKAGEDLMTSFNNIDDPLALTAFVNKMDKIGYHTNGAGALRQVLGDDNYVKVIATKYFASTGYADDIVGARAAIERGAANITQVSMSPKLKMDMGEYATKLGTQSQGFADVMKRLHQINPQMAKDEIKNVADFFSKQVTTEGDITVDTSMSPYIDNKSLDGDRTKTALMNKLAKDSGGKVDKVIVVGDSVISLDNLSGSMAIASVSKQAEATNEKILYEKQVAAEKEEYFKEAYPLLGDIGQATDVFGQVILGQLPGVFADFGSSIGDLVDRFTGHVAKNWEEDTKDVREFINEILPQEKEQVMDEFDKFIADTVVIDPREGIAHNTMSHYDDMTLANVLANNQHKVEVAKKLRAKVEDTVNAEVIDDTTVTDDRGLP